MNRKSDVAAPSTTPLATPSGSPSAASSSGPLVSIALPVRNGANFLGPALDSLLTQTFTDFELIIGDNASTDGTADVCRAAVEADPRVCYVRHEENLGASRNFNLLFSMASGTYFSWVSHDDCWHPELLARCVAALQADPGAVLAYGGTVEIDKDGRVLRQLPPRPQLESALPHIRLRDVRRDPLTLPVFGLIRADVLRHTSLLAPYTGSDRVLLAELCLRGHFREVPGELFVHRVHPSRSVAVHRTLHERMLWYDPSFSGRVFFPDWQRMRGYARAVRQAPLPLAERARCFLEVGAEAGRRWKLLTRDLVIGGRQALSRPRQKRLQRMTVV